MIWLGGSGRGGGFVCECTRMGFVIKGEDSCPLLYILLPLTRPEFQVGAPLSLWDAQSHGGLLLRGVPPLNRGIHISEHCHQVWLGLLLLVGW